MSIPPYNAFYGDDINTLVLYLNLDGFSTKNLSLQRGFTTKKEQSIWHKDSRVFLFSIFGLIAKVQNKKYLASVFHSGKGNIKDQIHDLLLHSKARIREFEIEKEKQPVKQK